MGIWALPRLLPNLDVNQPMKKKVKRYPIGSFQIDITDVCTAKGKL